MQTNGIVLPSVQKEEALRDMLSEGAFEVFVESTKSIWKYCCILLQWEDTRRKDA